MPVSLIPAYIANLIRHFEDLRDDAHGGSEIRKDKFREGGAPAGADRPPGFGRSEHGLVTRHGRLTESGLGRMPMEASFVPLQIFRWTASRHSVRILPL